jgi:predicted nucleotidyltransferase
MNRAELLAKLKELKPWLESQGIGRVRLFGSYARDEARPDSDVDLIVEITKPLGLAYFRIEEELSQKLGTKVEMTTEDAMHRIVRRHALQDAIDA